MINQNYDEKTGIRYGVINQNEVLQAWCNSAKADYGKPICQKCFIEADSVDDYLLLKDQGKGKYFCNEVGEEITDDWYCSVCDCGVDGNNLDVWPEEPLFHYYDKEGIVATCRDSNGSICITKSPHYTLCDFCSPYAPEAGHIMTQNYEGIRAYCFGHDWFENNKALYKVYSVETEKEVLPDDSERSRTMSLLW